MTQPGITTTELDGALGTVPANSNVVAIVGVSSAGTANTPAAYGSKTQLATDFGYGPLVEMAARCIDYGLVPLVVKTAAATNQGAMGSIDTSHVTGTLTGFVTHTASTYPFDDYQVRVLIIAGGTTGTAGITYQYSLDDGRTWSATQSLGTSLVLAIPNTGVSFTLTTGKTAVAGDYFRTVTTAPYPTASEATAALTPLQNSATPFELAILSFPIDGTMFDALETAFAAMATAGKPRGYIGGFRMETDGESASTYKTAFETALAAKATTYGSICASSAQVSSSVSGRAYARPTVFAAAPLAASVSAEVDIADVNLGPLTGVSLVDSNGNPVYHDESITPGLDDDRALVLRSWGNDVQGVYVNRPRLFSANGSDFSLIPHRRVMNLARIAVRAYLIRRLNRPVKVDTKTGYILEAEAREIEAGGRAALRAVLGDVPKASGWSFVLHRDDNILSTKTIHVDVRIIPLGYVETIVETIAFVNPALAAA